MGKVLRNLFWISYDHLGKLIVANALWFVISLAAVMIPVAIALQIGSTELVRSCVLAGALVISVLAVSSITAGIFSFTSLLVLKHDAQIADLFRGIQMHWKRAIPLGAVTATIWIVLAANLLFYVRLGSGNFWLGALLGGITLWLFVLYNLMLVYVPPLLVQRSETVAGILKLAALLTVSNIRLTFWLYISILIILFLSVATGIGIPFMTAGLSGVLLNVAYKELARRYEQMERHKAGLAPLEEEDEYAGRGLRDILRPWEM